MVRGFYVLVLVVFLAGCNGERVKVSDDKTSDATILFRNAISFNDGQKTSGASAFLIDFNNEKHMVTAKHMLNDWMGIEPEVLPSQLSGKLKTWFIHPLNSKEKIYVDKALRPNDNWKKDIVVLSLKEGAGKYKGLSLYTKQPKKGEVFYIIGCPYAEPECTQNKYKLIYQKTKGTQHRFFWPNKKISSRGFSGAPIIDASGRVIAVYTGYFTRDKVDHYLGQSVYEEMKRIMK